MNKYILLKLVRVWVMDTGKNIKDRLLYMHARLMEGKMLYKAEEAKRFGCSLRSIQPNLGLSRYIHFGQRKIPEDHQCRVE